MESKVIEQLQGEQPEVSRSLSNLRGCRHRHPGSRMSSFFFFLNKSSCCKCVASISHTLVQQL